MSIPHNLAPFSALAADLAQIHHTAKRLSGTPSHPPFSISKVNWLSSAGGQPSRLPLSVVVGFDFRLCPLVFLVSCRRNKPFKYNYVLLLIVQALEFTPNLCQMIFRKEGQALLPAAYGQATYVWMGGILSEPRLLYMLVLPTVRIRRPFPTFSRLFVVCRHFH